jgi:hypothetical protein
MIKAYLQKRNKSRSLTTQIREAEQQIVISQRGVGIRTATLIRKIHQQMTAPSTLLLAGGMGFLLGELTKRQTSSNRGAAGKQRTTETSPLKTALNLMISLHTLYTALPIAWLIKSFQKPRAPDRQASERQSQPFAAGNRRRSSR